MISETFQVKSPKYQKTKKSSTDFLFQTSIIIKHHLKAFPTISRHVTVYRSSQLSLRSLTMGTERLDVVVSCWCGGLADASRQFKLSQRFVQDQLQSPDHIAARVTVALRRRCARALWAARGRLCASGVGIVIQLDKVPVWWEQGEGKDGERRNEGGKNREENKWFFGADSEGVAS